MCNPIMDPSCVVKEGAQSAFQEIAESAAAAAGQMIVDSLTWWVRTPSVNPQTPAVENAQSYTLPLIGLILMGSVLAQAIRMTLSRKRDPALNVGIGLVRYLVVTSVGLVVLAGALKAGDDLSGWMVDQAMGDFANRMKAILTPAVITNPFGLLAMGGIGYVLGFVQWILGFIRQAGILVLAALLPLAAAGSINESTKPWLNRMLPWLVALVAYKPMAALIYSIGFTFMAGNDFATVITGLMVIVLSVIALPAMLRFFSWAGTNLQSGGGGAAMAGAMGAVALTGASSRSSAAQQAQFMEAAGPGSGPSGAASNGGGPQTTPVGPAGAAGPQSTPAAAQQATQTAGSAAPAAGGAAGAQTAGGAAGGAGAAGAATGGPAGAVVAGAQAGKQAARASANRMTGSEGDQQQ